MLVPNLQLSFYLKEKLHYIIMHIEEASELGKFTTAFASFSDYQSRQ